MFFFYLLVKKSFLKNEKWQIVQFAMNKTKIDISHKNIMDIALKDVLILHIFKITIIHSTCF